jgi:V/A-type H+/Na+-transporting ATPase subunit B
MSLQLLGLDEIQGSLVALDHVENVSNEEMVEIELNDGSTRSGRVVSISGDKAIIQVFQGTEGISLTNTKTKLLGHPMELGLSREILGRTFNGTGEPIDGLGEIYADKFEDVNGKPLNPYSRQYPRNYIQTGISAIDGLNTLIRGQKLPIFSGSGLPHDQLAIQIVKQAKLTGEDAENFCIVFGAMGVKNDVADLFRRSFEETGVMEKVVMFVNLADDPIVERMLTPRCALTAAEYLAYDCGMNVLVILTDMTSYCEAVREFSSSKGEIPSRKGYPGYLYSDLACLYERAGIIKGGKGSVTQIPILTMPNDDITHPVPDLTGYITEGQIVLDRDLFLNNITPPIGVLSSLSRLMKDGIGEGYTRKDHQDISNQLFASYAKVQDARSLASVIGEDELSETDKKHMEFGRLFESVFIGQGFNVNRSMEETLNLGWALLSTLPVEALDRLDSELIKQNYDPEHAMETINMIVKNEGEE